ncbi:MAG: elongation factor 4 [Candidatus Magasanikbacteria bacterium]|nr:elongation factor 4 [Candidatus Magasanikbacteria bacterium]
MINNIRNFCIIAHIDHGKSTLADRLLEFTGTVAKREMKAQLLDSMDLERERGITIKLTPVRMEYNEHILNLIDTPGHVDFNYEVSRSLAAVEGAILLVDASQGVQAQTIGNLYLALEQNLKIIPVINKIDLQNARVEQTENEIINLLGCEKKDILRVSAKTGEGVKEIIATVIDMVPPPKNDAEKPLRALIFDSVYDDYRGVVAYCRVVDGEIKAGDKMFLMATGLTSEVLEVGYFKPKYNISKKIATGEIGYIVTGLKNIEGCRVGDTITLSLRAERSNLDQRQDRHAIRARDDQKITPLAGYKKVNPMVFAGIFCQSGADYEHLRQGILKLKLSDSSLIFEPEQSSVLGFGFRCGFLGLLHLDIFQERIKREYKLPIIVTVPSVAYQVTKTSGETKIIKSPAEWPDPSQIIKAEEPWVKADIVAPKEFIGQIMALAEEKILVDFYDRLKSASSGYASLNYELSDYKEADIVKLNVLVAEEDQEALASLVYRQEAYNMARRITEKLKESLPRQMFEIKIQAAIGGKIIASERIPAMRKDVLAKMSGGDWTRKSKLLQKQKKGKTRMKAAGHVQIPTETYLAILKK